jgi:hypothetical protein
VQYVLTLFSFYNPVIHACRILFLSRQGRRKLGRLRHDNRKIWKYETVSWREDCVIYVVRSGYILINVYNGRPGFIICPILLLWKMGTTHSLLWFSHGEKVCITSLILWYFLTYLAPLNKPLTLVLRDKIYLIANVDSLKY